MFNFLSIYLILFQVETKCKQDFIGSPGVNGSPGNPGPAGVPGVRGIRGERGAKGFSYIVDPFPLPGPKGRKGQPGIKNLICFYSVTISSTESWPLRPCLCHSLSRSTALILKKYIKHERPCLTPFPNTENRVENTTRSGVFLTQLEVLRM